MTVFDYVQPSIDKLKMLFYGATPTTDTAIPQTTQPVPTPPPQPTTTTAVPEKPATIKQPTTPQLPKFDWAGFMKILTSPYATPAGIEYALGTALNVYKAMIDEYNARVNEQKALAAAETAVTTKAMQILPQLYAQQTEIYKIIADPTVPPAMKAQLINRALEINERIKSVEGGLFPQTTTSNASALPLDQQVKLILEAFKNQQKG